MDRISFQCEVVTPMFIGGADKIKAEFRESSLKGLLRFWWRMINAYRFSTTMNMLKEENTIFGSTNNASTFKIQISEIDKNPVLLDLDRGKKYKELITIKDKNKEKKGNPNLNNETLQPEKREIELGIIDYLAYGSLMEYDKDLRSNKYIKSHYPSGTKFKISFIFKNNSYRFQVLQSFDMLANYGGMGSKSRNGFGSFRIIGGEEPLKDVNLNINNINIYENVEPREFLILSKEHCLVRFNKADDKWECALSKVGLTYRSARLSIENKHQFSQRAKIGLPIVAKYENVPEQFKKARLSKPLFMHIIKDNNKYIGQIFLIPYKFKDSSQDEYDDVDYDIDLSKQKTKDKTKTDDITYYFDKEFWENFKLSLINSQKKFDNPNNC